MAEQKLKLFGPQQARSLQELLSILYFIDANSPVSRAEIIDFIIRYRASKGLSETTPPSPLTVTRQIGIMRDCLKIELDSHPHRGISLIDWGVFDPSRIREAVQEHCGPELVIGRRPESTAIAEKDGKEGEKS